MTTPSTSDSRRSVAPLLSFARAWKDGACPSVETFLADKHPAGVNVDDLLDLIQQEIVSREARGETPQLEDYQQRFPAHADHIGALFEVNALFATGLPEDDGPEGPDLTDYEVEGRLAAGGMGEVYGARDAALGRRVAVKVLRPEWQDDPSSVARFWGEARTTARLQHPGVVPVYEAGLDARDRPFIAMKLVEGRTLAALLADRPDPAHNLTDFIGIFEHVCQTLAYAHQQKVIHRDLKPANVMVGGFGEVQVMDWGLAKRLGDEYRQVDSTRIPHMPKKVDSTVPIGGLTVAGEMIGTPGYMPPEQARGDHDRVGPASDVFGLGAILCEILTGKAPFDTVARARAADLAPARDRLAWVAGEADLVRIALDCLASDPADRPADAGAVCVALAAYRTGLRERVRAAEHAAVKAVAERKARRRAEILRLLAVLFVLAAGLGGWGWFQHQADLARDVEAALDEAQAGRDKSNTPGDPFHTASERAVHRAGGLMRGLTGRSHLHARYAALVADLERDAADPAMVRKLEEIRLKWDPAERDPTERDQDGPPPTVLYAAAFREYGIDVTALAPEEAARRITTRTARAHLITALDYWGLECLTTQAEDPAARHALAVTRAADPDPWRNQFRDAVAARDLPALRRMAGEAKSRDLPVPLLVVLGAAVADRSSEIKKKSPALAKVRITAHFPPDPAGLALLREARRRAPADFWANYHLARALQYASPKVFHEVARYYAAAAALRPDLPRVRGMLAYALVEAGDFPGALAACREEVAARPADANVRCMLGRYLDRLGDLPAAVAEFREAVRLDPKYSQRSALVGALAELGDRAGALAEVRAWAAAEPADLIVRRRLVTALTATGRHAEALAESRRESLDPKDPGWAELNLRRAERMVAITDQIVGAADPAALPIPQDERWNYVQAAFDAGRDAAAVRFLERALASPGPIYQDGFLAGVAAAVRLGSDPRLDTRERTRYRLLALEWLKSGLNRRDPARPVNLTPGQRLAIREGLRRWEVHLDLAPVRDPAALAAMSGLERAGWRMFWAEVKARIRSLDRVD